MLYFPHLYGGIMDIYSAIMAMVVICLTVTVFELRKFFYKEAEIKQRIDEATLKELRGIRSELEYIRKNMEK